MKSGGRLRVGDWVRVRSKEEILSSLDENGRLEQLPFMPEMFAFCGQRFRVVKRAHKTCDPPNGLEARRMPRAVHLDGVRCDGSAHGGCQARCLLFWKEDWLQQVGGPPGSSRQAGRGGTCTESVIWAAVHSSAPAVPPQEAVYVCQSTEIAAATRPLRWWDPRQYWEDLSSGNVTLPQMLAAAVFFVYHHLADAGFGCGSLLRWLYDRFQALRGGSPYPWRTGRVAVGSKTPAETLNLQPGEWVRVKSYQAILDTLNQDNLNRGMWFDAEMVPFCGGTYRVLDRISRIIDEKTGRLLNIKNDCIILENVTCQARYAKHRRFCPRAIYPYWREVWLERVPAPCGSEALPRADVTAS